MLHEKVDLGLASLSLGDRLQRLEEYLIGRGLTPPAAVGDLSAHEAEIVELTDIYCNGAFFADLEFLVRWQSGKEPVPFVMRSNKGGAGAVFVPVIAGLIALVRQWRPCLGRWTWEVPRGFSELWEPARSGEILLPRTAIPKGFATAMAELEEEVGTGDVVSPKFLGEIAENSGFTTTSPAYWLLRINDTKIGGRESFRVRLVTPEQAYSMIGGELADNHSIVAITLALKALSD
jgi:hypothetical protein